MLTKNFDSSEFECPCCHKVIICKSLVVTLQRIRDAVEKPIIVTSGYRCPARNKDVGGVVNSYHTQGKAADFKIPGMTPTEVLEFIEKNLPDIANSCGIGTYSSWTHLDVRGKKARWSK